VPFVFRVDFVLTGQYKNDVLSQRRKRNKKNDNPKRSTRDRILDAAEVVVEEHGVGSLAFDAVAAQAGVSKGTTLYHFGSKDALASAMIQRFVMRFDTAWAEAICDDEETLGRNTRAYVTATRHGEAITGKAFSKVNGAITAALANFPEKVEIVREQGARHQRAIEADGIDPVLATIIRMANDGMWFAESFNLMRYDSDLKDAVEQRLLSWTRTGNAPEGNTARLSNDEHHPNKNKR
jgi:AcrR family transcriptional regulator